jgi:hypothetical protein
MLTGSHPGLHGPGGLGGGLPGPSRGFLCSVDPGPCLFHSPGSCTGALIRGPTILARPFLDAPSLLVPSVVVVALPILVPVALAVPGILSDGQINCLASTDRKQQRDQPIGPQLPALPHPESLPQPLLHSGARRVARRGRAESPGGQREDHDQCQRQDADFGSHHTCLLPFTPQKMRPAPPLFVLASSPPWSTTSTGPGRGRRGSRL